MKHSVLTRTRKICCTGLVEADTLLSCAMRSEAALLPFSGNGQPRRKSLGQAYAAVQPPSSDIAMSTFGPHKALQDYQRERAGEQPGKCI
eukprot:3389262-Amphidinium_carterae.3